MLGRQSERRSRDGYRRERATTCWAARRLYWTRLTCSWYPYPPPPASPGASSWPRISSIGFAHIRIIEIVFNVRRLNIAHHQTDLNSKTAALNSRSWITLASEGKSFDCSGEACWYLVPGCNRWRPGIIQRATRIAAAPTRPWFVSWSRPRQHISYRTATRQS